MDRRAKEIDKDRLKSKDLSDLSDIWEPKANVDVSSSLTKDKTSLS